MKYIVKILVPCLLLFATVSAVGYFTWYKPKFNHKIYHSVTLKRNSLDQPVILRLKQKAGLFKIYNKDVDYNTGFCFLIDMRISSGKKRFFVYNIEKDSVEAAGLVTHGSGSDKGSGDLFFSNTVNSNCTSLGKYKIGSSYYGKFGLAFKLYGLDKTNSKAFERCVAVLIIVFLDLKYTRCLYVKAGDVQLYPQLS